MLKNLILHTTSLHKIERREVGGKGWNLFHLHHLGFPVPPFCVIPAFEFEAALGKVRASIDMLINNLDPSEPSHLEATSAEIRRLICSLGLAQGSSEALSDRLKELLAGPPLFAVRSSVIDEDSERDSFAGQMDSFLNTPAGAVSRAIKKTWASAYSPRALTYRHRKNIGLSDISVAVIIQVMVQSKASGVLFTREPETAAKRCVIAAGFGLGEGVVQNRVASDTYRVFWDDDTISKDVATKDYEVVSDSRTSNGTRVRPVRAALRNEPVLSDLEILQLRDIGVRGEQCFRISQDLEWAYDASGQLFLLQARPIVSCPNAVRSGGRIWDNSNIVESYPNLTLPLTFSFVRTHYEASFRRAAVRFLFFKRALKEHRHVFRNLIGLLNGRIYYNLLNWYEMLSFLPAFERHKEAWDQMIGISKKVDFPRGKLSPIDRVYCWLMVIRTLLRAEHTAHRFFTHFQLNYQRFQKIDLETASPHRSPIGP